MSIIAAAAGWYFYTLIVGALVTNIIAAIVSVLPQFRQVLRYTIPISVAGVTFTLTGEVIVGHLIRLWLGI